MDKIIEMMDEVAKNLTLLNTEILRNKRKSRYTDWRKDFGDGMTSVQIKILYPSYPLLTVILGDSECS